MSDRAFIKRARQIDMKLRGRWRPRYKVLLCIVGCAFTVLILCVCLFKRSEPDYILTSSGHVPVYRQRDHLAFHRWLDNSTKYNFNYRTIVLPEKPCPRDLLVVITSAPGNVHRRQAIRSTWAKDAEAISNSSVIFVIGQVIDNNHLIDVRYEIESRGDILMFDFYDSYRNATIKTVLSFKYAAECKPRYFLKADDDTYVNIERLMDSVKHLERTLNEPFIAGQVHSKEVPHRWITKWTVSRDQYPEAEYPPYVSGNLYIVSGNLLSRMAATAEYTPPLDLEDVFMTGLVASKLSLPRLDIEGIRDRKRSSTSYCSFDNLVSGHYVDPDEMTQIHTARSSFTEDCVRFLGINWCTCVPKLRAIFI